jgi:hypothetical protein
MDIPVAKLIEIINDELQSYNMYMELDMPELAKDELKHANKLMKLLKFAKNKEEVENGD